MIGEMWCVMLMVMHKILELKMKVVDIGESNSGESKQNFKKSLEKKKKIEHFRKWCLEEVRETSKVMMNNLKATKDIKSCLLMSMQKIMKTLVEKL